MPRARVSAASAAILSASLWVTPAVAQWTLGAGLRAPRFSGAAVEPATGLSLRPYRPTLIELSLNRQGARLGIGLRVHYASSSLALEGSDGLAAVKDALTLYGAEPEVSVRLSGVGPGGVLRVFAGPVLEVWKLPDIGSHFRVGLAGSLGLEVPFGGSWSGAVRVGGAVSPSPFEQEDLNDLLEPRTLWRREAAAELRYRL